MKKLALIAITSAALAGASFAQGLVQFANTATASTKISASIGGVTNLLSGAQGTYAFALFVALPATSGVTGNVWTDPNWTPVTAALAFNTGVAGRIQGSSEANLTETHLPTAGTWAGGNLVNTYVIGWDTATGGNTLSSFINAYNGGTINLYGTSRVGLGLKLGDGASIGSSTVFGTTASQLPGFVLTSVPEPATFALAGLGIAAMLVSRRRK